MTPAARTPPIASRLPEAGAILEALVRSMAEAGATLPPGTPDPEVAEARLVGGIPALEGERLISWSALVAAAHTVARALAETPAGAAALGAVRRLERDPAIDGTAVTGAVLSGAWDLVEALLPRGLDRETALTLLDYAARPALRAGAVALQPLLHRVAWGRGRCPICGAPPAIAVVQGKERERRLCCGRCGTLWTYERVRCAGCGERSHERLGALHAAGEGEFRRADVCESCGGYLKCVAVLDLPDADRVLGLDLETAGLDFLALEGGYRRVGGEEESA